MQLFYNLPDKVSPLKWGHNGLSDNQVVRRHETKLRFRIRETNEVFRIKALHGDKAAWLRQLLDLHSGLQRKNAVSRIQHIILNLNGKHQSFIQYHRDSNISVAWQNKYERRDG